MTMTDYEVVTDRRTGLRYRADTYDLHVIGERRSYTRAVPPRPDDVLLDVGANIGSVSLAWLQAGASVVAFEPEPENYRLLTTNLTAYDLSRAVALEAAVGGPGSSEERLLWTTRGSNLGIHSTVQRRGRVPVPVRCYPLAGMWAAYRPTVLKIDIEGGEYELLPDLVAIPDHVRAVIIELHLTKGEWRFKLAPQVVRAMAHQGFMVVREPVIGLKNWTTLGAWTR